MTKLRKHYPPEPTLAAYAVALAVANDLPIPKWPRPEEKSMTKLEEIATVMIDAVSRHGRDEPSLSRDDALIAARAAVEAMREPNKAMMRAGWDSGPYPDPGSRAEPPTPREVWGDMIDAILAEKP